MSNDLKMFENAPEGKLAIIPLKSCQKLGDSIDFYLTKWRKESKQHYKDTIVGYSKESFILNVSTPRFGNGEAKGQVNESVRGCDIYILVDVSNHSCTYKMYDYENHMSPDDHYQDLKRVIAAIGGKAKRINVIMPFLYEGRQHRRSSRESLDCAMALQELMAMGVDNIITFDAHDPRVQNAIPLGGFDTIRPSYQFLKGIMKNVKDIQFDNEHLMIVSPDEGATERAVYMANVLGVNMGMFYKRRDYTRIVDGKNPIVAHEFLGDDVEGKDVFVLDDMIASGESMIDVAKQLKARGANRIFVIATFGLFTSGISRFDQAVEEGLIYKVVTTNLTYINPEITSRPYYILCDMSKYISYIIDTLNHDATISELLDPSNRIKEAVAEYKRGEFREA